MGATGDLGDGSRPVGSRAEPRWRSGVKALRSRRKMYTTREGHDKYGIHTALYNTAPTFSKDHLKFVRAL